MRFQSMYTDLFATSQQVAGQPEHLQQVIDRYPYFSLAHFFLLDNVQEENEAYPRIASKTALHFNNPFLLNEHVHPPKRHDVSSTNGLTPYDVETRRDEQAEAETLIETAPTANVEAGEQRVETAASPVIDIPGVAHTVNLHHPAEINNDAVTRDAQHPSAPEQPADIVIDNSDVNIPLPSNNAPVSEGADVKPADEKEEAPIFEPLFASDYFASQGIKLSEEQQPADRMGQQLKSFTAWLKTMKKVHETKVPLAEAPVDVTVQTLAEKSNTGEEVVTEAMAEVYLQQGKGNKAREIYQKLSLLNPSKSAYFAAKLDQIK